MDEKDKKILYELDADARLTYSQLGRRLRMSPETARYRVQRLVEQGIIKGFISVLNTYLFNYSYYELFLKLKRLDARTKRTFIEYLKAKESIAWVGEFDGSFDVGLICVVKNQRELDVLMNDLHKEFGSIFMKKTLAVNLWGEFLPRDYLVKKSRNPIGSHSYAIESSAIKLDELDASICSLLATNCRESSIEIGKKTGRTSDVVLQRISKLRRQQVITKYTIIVDTQKMSMQHFKVLLYLAETDSKHINTMLQYIRSNPNVTTIVKTLSEWDYEIDLEVESTDHVRLFKMELANLFPQTIMNHDTLQVVSMPKFNFFPVKIPRNK